MDESQSCPICTMTDLIHSAGSYECMTCGHEWTGEAVSHADDPEREVMDAHGNVLVSGDTVTVVKDLKVKGSSTTLKVGTRITGIRIVSGDHEIDCKVEGRAIMLKGKFLKKA